jgi:hypothetical protein
MLASRLAAGRWLKRAMIGLAVVSCAVAANDFFLGGFVFAPFGIRVSSWEAYKPFRNGLLSACVALWLHERESEAAISWHWIARWSRPIAAAAVAVSCVMALRFGVFVAGGADAYGYVSQALRWASGAPMPPEPLAALAAALGPSIVPIGYRPSLTPGHSVPFYPPGLPLVMAVASKIAGPSAVYIVVPIFGGVAVWLTYLIGVRTFGRRTGFLAAILLTCSPIFLFQTLEPMSDVPATAWWLAAWLFAISDGAAAALLAGLAGSAAVVTRPNLVPLALVLAGAVILGRPRVARAVWFAVGLVPGCLAVAAFNQYFYGTPLSSGYGPLATLFEWSRVSANLHRYPVWLVELHTPVILLALAAPFAGRRELDAPFTRPDSRAVAALMLAFSAVLLLCYVFWVPYDNWPFLRFLLPAIPLLLISSTAVAVALIQRAPLPYRTAGFFVIGILLGCWCLVKAQSLGVFATADIEHRYVAVGEHISRAVPPNAVFLSVMESGSIRFYGHRVTVRWDTLEPHDLDGALDLLGSAGYVPYILLESWEEELFRARFGSQSAVGWVDWPPAFQYRGPIDVRIYSVDDRAEYVNGGNIVTQEIPAS